MTQQWKLIDSAPKTGRTLLLGYWNSHGKWRTVRGQWMSAEYIAQEWEEPDDVEAGWFETAVEADDEPNCWPVNPSHWQPMPAPPCPTCNDQGAVGNILTAQPCPDCSTPPASAQDDAKDERQAFEAWAKKKKMPLARVGQQYDDFWVDHAWNGWQARASVAAPAAGDEPVPVLNIEAAAKALAECMGYSWAHMPELGRGSMREHAQTVIRAASQQQEG